MADKKTDKKVESGKSDKKPGFFSKLGKYFRACMGEVKKIVWPTPKATFKNMGIVLVIIAVVGLFIFGLDRGLFALLDLIMNVNTN